MGPYKCPDCGIWWAGFEHRCQPNQTRTGVDPFAPFVPGPPYPYITTNTVRCTCPPNRGDNFLGRCPIHDVQVTNTAGHA